MKKTEVESPFAGKVNRNIRYARRCMSDSLKKGEAPLASHLLYTQPGILNDNNPEERKLGMEVGKVWSTEAEKVVFYVDYGWSSGMTWGKKVAKEKNIPMEERTIGKNTITTEIIDCLKDFFKISF